MGKIWGRGRVQNLFRTHVVERPLISIVPSILNLDFDLILRSFLTSGALMGKGSILFWSVLHIVVAVECSQLLLCVNPTTGLTVNGYFVVGL